MVNQPDRVKEEATNREVLVATGAESKEDLEVLQDQLDGIRLNDESKADSNAHNTVDKGSHPVLKLCKNFKEEECPTADECGVKEGKCENIPGGENNPKWAAGRMGCRWMKRG